MSKPTLRQNGQSFTFKLTDAAGRSNDGRAHFFELHLKPHDVVILHPSLGCPLIAKPGDDLRIFLLTDKDFQQLFDTDADTIPLPDTDPPLPNPNGLYYKRGGPQAKAVINRMLKILQWDAGKKIEDVPLYPDTATALANIDVTSLGDANGFKDGRLYDKDGALFALLRDSSRSAYARLNAQYLFQLDLKVGAMSKPPKSEGLYDIAWLLPDPQQPTSLASYAELQDRATQSFIQNNRVDACVAGVPLAYKVDGDQQFDFTFDDKIKIQNRHPILITGKAKLNLGHLTDVHVSSRQAVFRRSTAQVLQDADAKATSEPLGEIVNISYDTLKDLLDQLRDDASIDALVLTGDLIDFNRNLDPTTMSDDWATHFASPGNVWEAMHRDHHHSDRYPGYIDDLMIYSLLDSFYKNGKPVFMISGNHEAYALPYGISPRVLKPNPLTPAGAKRANEGIPADHNLTIYEALLLYGPDYHFYDKVWNFDKTKLPWFYTVFTPLTDYIVQHQAQCFVGVSWGDDEDIFGNPGGGVLPRSTQALTDAQKELVEQASQRGSERILFTHFTLASYSPEIPLTVSGKINCNDHLQTYSDYEQGSFKGNRKALYRWIGENKFKVVLSGHSHRAALYEPRYDGGRVRDTLHTVGHEIKTQDMALPFHDQPALIVSACGGPIAVQNHYDTDPNDKKAPKHLKGYGLDWPSGTRITLDGGVKIKRVLPRKDKVPSAQPRFAVAMDFFDMLEEKVFATFESETDAGEFNVKINANLPKQRFIEGMGLFAYVGGSWKEFKTTVTDKAPGSLIVTGTLHEDAFQKKVMKEENPVVFLAVTFNTTLAETTGYSQYNFKSPWLFRVEVKPRTELQWIGESREYVEVGGYTITRHEKHGEIPDFKWYKKNFKNLYTYGRELPKSATKDI